MDNLEEQAVLEELLEASKPDYPDTYPNTLHYLLKNPFRYPPLRWGSRFDRVHEPSLFYGGKSLEVTLAESAFYRFVFICSMQGTAPASKLNTEHTLFTVSYKTDKVQRKWAVSYASAICTTELNMINSASLTSPCQLKHQFLHL